MAAETASKLPLWADVPYDLESELRKLIEFARYMGQGVGDDEVPDEPSEAPRA